MALIIQLKQLRPKQSEKLTTVENLSKQFIITYLNYIRHSASQIPCIDRGIFPSYWFNPYQIIIHKNDLEDLAIVLKRKVAGKADKLSVRNSNGRIEESVLPNLNYEIQPMLRIEDDHHHITISGFASGGTFDVNNHPLLTIGTGAEAKFLDIRVEAAVEKYPMEFEWLWFLTFPNEKYLTRQRAEEHAEHDFWGRFSSVLAKNIDSISSLNLGGYTAKVFRQYLKKVHSELCRLVTRNDLAEQQLQNFLDEHYFLLSEDKPIFKKSRTIGGYATDFTIERSDGSVLLIELQLNSDPIMSNDEPSRGLSEAIGQLKEWFRWIEDFDGSSLYKYSGLIIIGRESDYAKHKKPVDEILFNLNLPVRLKTYDSLASTIEKIEEAFRIAEFSNKRNAC